ISDWSWRQPLIQVGIVWRIELEVKRGEIARLLRRGRSRPELGITDRRIQIKRHSQGYPLENDARYELLVGLVRHLSLYDRGDDYISLLVFGIGGKQGLGFHGKVVRHLIYHVCHSIVRIELIGIREKRTLL